MTFHYENQASIAPAILPPETQQAIWFLGALIHTRAGAGATGDRLAIVEHHTERGLASPLHRHRVDDETFLVREGGLRVEVDGQARAAGAGAVAFLPRGLPTRVRRHQPAGPVPHHTHRPASTNSLSLQALPLARPAHRPSTSCYPTRRPSPRWPPSTASSSWAHRLPRDGGTASTQED